MLQERMAGMVAEIGEIADLAELKALWCFGQRESNEYGDAACVPHFKDAVARLRNQVKEEVPMETMNLEARIAELLAQVEALKSRTVNDQNKSGTTAQPPVKPVVRGGKRYRLLSTDVSWSTKPQVAALMQILEAHMKVGDVLDEATIVQACITNEHVLQTRQGGARIFAYYKGNHAEGLMMHGNLEVV